REGMKKEERSGIRLSNFGGSADLSVYGYPPVNVLHGVDIAAHVHLFEDRRIYAVAPATPPFKYRVRADRDIAAAERQIELCFPPPNLNRLRLIIQSKGLMQLDHGDPPIIFIAGQSGAGKSKQAELAAVIACEKPRKFKFTKDAEKQRSRYLQLSKECTILIC